MSEKTAEVSFQGILDQSHRFALEDDYPSHTLIDMRHDLADVLDRTPDTFHGKTVGIHVMKLINFELISRGIDLSVLDQVLDNPEAFAALDNSTQES